MSNLTRMKYLLISVIFLFGFQVQAQSEWPRSLETSKGAKILIYQPQPETLTQGKLTGRAAVSVRETPSSEPVFGAFWYETTLLTDRDTRMATMESIKVTDVKFPDVTDADKLQRFTTFLEQEIPKWNLEISIDAILATLEQEQPGTIDDLKNDPPQIIYTTVPSTLVIIDGEPKFQQDDKLKMERVMNTPFLIIKSNEDKKYYLLGGTIWYTSASVKEGWKSTTQLPKSIKELDKQVKEQQKKNTDASTATKPADTKPREIIVSITPAELIQSGGEAAFVPIQGTGLLYMNNSENDVFMEISQQKYFVLLSGRWYQAAALKGPWTYVASDKLPTDFQKIPEGSEKDNVLSSVAGTQAAEDAVKDAQIPQTAKVDRKNATCTVKYDGEPKFEPIEGTKMKLAMNTSSTVLQSGDMFYCVENGVWFNSSSAKGPWTVSTERPSDVDDIPPNSAAYNVKYVYIYDTTPEYVYVGYTPGYMGCYVYGPTVVYGTGYYYSPWYGPYYYPRPVTYGFSMHYNPWTGWSMGFHYSAGFFHFSYYGGGGYWGPPMYRPPYHHPPYHGGYYGRGGNQINHYGDVNINVDRSNNIYNNRNDVSTRDVQRGNNKAGNSNVSTNDRQTNRNQATQKPTTSNNQRQPNNVQTDKRGNVYQQKNDGNWQQRSNNQWQDINREQSNVNDMNRQQQQRDRGNTRQSNFNNNNRGGNMGGGSRSAGGMSRGGGRRG